MNDKWNGVNVALSQFGLPAKAADRAAILAALEDQIRLEADETGDQFLMRLLCAQLFSLGVVEDSLVVWRAKSCAFDTMFGIDVQFMCGAGLEQTMKFLKTVDNDDARDAWAYLNESSDDFVGFSTEHILEYSRAFYYPFRPLYSCHAKDNHGQI